MTKFGYHLLWAILFLLFCVLSLVLFWLVYPYKILEFRDGNATLLQKTVRSGDYLQLRQHVRKYKSIPGTVDRQFIDSIIYQIPPSLNNRPPKVYDQIEYIYIPKVLPPGKYYIVTVISYQVNPIRRVSYTVQTETFTVTNGVPQ